MDVPYNKSGASSRAHYQIVRNVENTPHQSEQLILQEVERIKQRIAGRMLSTSELRKDLIVLLYCLNSSFSAVNGTTLAFALPSAVHLAEAGSRASEKRIGYLFCSEVMPQEHEMQLMLVNTIRKDLTSSSTARINLALECLVNSPSADVIPAVHTRCVELLSHPSPRIRVLAMDAILSLSRLTPDLLNDEKIKHLVLKRMSDSDESVVRAALRMSLTMMENRILKGGEIMRFLLDLISHISDKHASRNHSTSFAVAILQNISKISSKDISVLKAGPTDELLLKLFTLLRRAVKHDQQPMILECFRLLGRFPPTAVADLIKQLSSQNNQEGGPDKPQPQFIHPVARIRHFLSSRTVNEHFLFLSCLACLHPTLWAGIQVTSEELLTQPAVEVGTDKEESQKTGIPLILDQWEVERILSFLEGDDNQIRGLTLKILISLDPSLVESCYSRALDASRNSGPSNSSDERKRRVLLHRLLELAFSVSLGNKTLTDADLGRIFAQKMQEVVSTTDANGKVDPEIVETVLNRMRNETTSTQHSCIAGFLSLVLSMGLRSSDGKLVDPTLLLILLALICETPNLKAEAVSTICSLATLLEHSPTVMQEPILVCMSRLAFLSEFSPEIEDPRRVVRGLGEASAADKKRALVHRRCEQFLVVSADQHAILEGIGNDRPIPLPEFALLLDQLDVRKSFAVEPPAQSSSPSIKLTSPTMSRMDLSPLSQSKLRYDAYAPPLTSSGNRLGRAHSQSSTASGRSTNRPSSRASSTRSGSARPVSRGVVSEMDLTKTVTAGELTLAVGGESKFGRASDGKAKERKGPEGEQATRPIEKDVIPPKAASNLIPLDSPFLSEPLVDVVDQTPSTPPVSSPYVSANTSLRTSPERAPSFEELWSVLVNEEAFSARGWYDDASDVAVRRLQSLRLRMEVLPADVAPYEGDLKVSLYSISLDINLPCALLRLHEESDGSCLWQVKCTDAEIGLKVKELLR